jgi:hypothetical protein
MKYKTKIVTANSTYSLQDAINSCIETNTYGNWHLHTATPYPHPIANSGMYFQPMEPACLLVFVELIE